jgi:hypothetical protein
MNYVRYYVHQSQWDFLVSAYGKTWTEHHCILIKPIPLIKGDYR